MTVTKPLTRIKKPMKNRNRFVGYVILLSIAMLAGLVATDVLLWATVGPGQAVVNRGKPSVLGLPQTLIPASSEPSFRYSVQGKVDPFKPFISPESVLKTTFGKRLPKSISSLQLYPIEQYRLVGIAGSNKGYTAIVKDIVGKFYPLTVGTIIGVEKGRVVQIQINKVLVEEKISRDKQTKFRTTYMTFQSEEEGKP